MTQWMGSSHPPEQKVTNEHASVRVERWPSVLLVGALGGWSRPLVQMTEDRRFSSGHTLTLRHRTGKQGRLSQKCLPSLKNGSPGKKPSETKNEIIFSPNLSVPTETQTAIMKVLKFIQAPDVTLGHRVLQAAGEALWCHCAMASLESRREELVTF